MIENDETIINDSLNVIKVNFYFVNETRSEDKDKKTMIIEIETILTTLTTLTTLITSTFLS